MSGPLTFRSSQTTAPDPTEPAMHAVIDVAKDFAHAIADARTVSRAIQLRQRLGVCIALLTEVEAAALKKMDKLP